MFFILILKLVLLYNYLMGLLYRVLIRKMWFIWCVCVLSGWFWVMFFLIIWSKNWKLLWFVYVMKIKWCWNLLFYVVFVGRLFLKWKIGNSSLFVFLCRVMIVWFMRWKVGRFFCFWVLIVIFCSRVGVV